MRVFVMGSRTWQEFSLWPPAGETERWYLGRGGTLTPGRPPARRAPPRPLPLQPARPDAGRGRPVAQHGHGGAQGPAPPRAPPRRADLHQPRAHRGPHRHRPADGHALPALVARAHRLLRAPLRRDGEGQVVQPQRRHRPARARLGRARTRTASSGSTSPCGPRPTRSGPATASACRSRAAPTRSSTATPAPASRWRRAPTCARPTRRSSTTPPAPRRSRCPSCALLQDELAGRAWNGFARPPRLVSRA